ncbi:ABC transporter ATP-binding protein [Methanosalsum natronophilum]|uniref:ABC transporter ATP-binding protein n=1 Tax=Methanosalsum natronophilum TaxID=768733 RepID=UPI0021696034|nr:ABC transporter ATP-binding protein [Methanosalsum natronophilum]MCS3923234.1 ABC-type multidrug transport system fused ATPase/permease subunit [Methanosalsum natronophilum]
MFNFVNKLKDIFTPKELRGFVILLFLTIATGISQAVSVVSIFPFMDVITNPNIIEENYWLNLIYTELGFTSSSDFIIFLGSATLTLLIVSNAISAFTIWYKAKFVWANNHSISKRLLDIYLRQNYPFFLSKNSADVSKNILSEVQLLTTGYMIPLLHAISGVIISLTIIGSIFIVSPYATLFAILIFGGIYGLIYTFFRNKLRKSGKSRLNANQERFSVVNEAFGGIKDIKLKGNELFYLKMFSKPSKVYADTMAKNKVIGELPKFLLETLAFGGIIAFILILYLLYGDVGNVIPIASLFAFAGYRLLPSLQKVYDGVTKVRFNYHTIDNIRKEMANAENIFQYQNINIEEIPSETIELEKEIRLEGVKYSYPNSTHNSLDGVDISVKKGTSVAVVGTTGAGKTTLVDVILGLLLPQEGTIYVDDTKITESNLRAWQKNLGYVPQHIYLANSSVKNNIAFGIPDDQIDMEQVIRSAKIANIHDFVMEEMQDGYDTIVGERGVRLSGGQRQRVGIARALYHDPDVLVLDEATSSLDGMTEKAFVDALNKLAKVKTLIIIAHRFNTIQNCDKIYMLEKGRITAEGTYSELLDSNSRFQLLANEKDRK